MNGYSSHTYSWINAAGQRFWVKYHFKTVHGTENFTDEEAGKMAAEDPDFHRRDLRAAIEHGQYPEWELEMQIMPFEEAADYRFNPFDLTKVWPHGDYPPVKVGRLVLDRNPENFFAEVEQATFNPSNLVPGVGLSPDRMLMARVFSYHDTHLYRVGTNYEQLAINAPHSEVHSYNKDGAMTYRHSGAQPVYAPNSFGGPQSDTERGKDLGWEVEAGELGRYSYEKHAEDDDFGQPGTLYREVMSDIDREHLVTNIVGHASDEVSEEMQLRVIAYWTKIDPELGARVAAGLGHGNGSADSATAKAAEELVAARANRA
jgi:catalase